MKKIGILGGMGPQASIRFYSMLIDIAIKQGAAHNADFPYILLANIPVPDLIGDQVDQDVAIDMVTHAARDLQRAGAELLVMPCNTMHLYADRFSQAAQLPFISMIDAVIDEARVARYAKVGVIGTPTTLKTGLYDRALAHMHITVIKAHRSAETVIQSVIADTVGPDDIVQINAICAELTDAGAEAIILGCTELPIIQQQIQTVVPLIDSTCALARATLTAAMR